MKKRTVILSSMLMMLPLGGTLQAQTAVGGSRSQQAQQKMQSTDGVVNGVVVDEEGNPLAGATILIKGSKYGVAANASGEFSLPVGKDVTELLVNYVGMDPVVIKLTDASFKSPIKVAMRSNAELIDEVVVTGYQTLSKERATGSFDVIDKKQLQKPAASIAQRLIGASAALVANQDAYGNPSFKIRGNSSFNAGNAPLLVVDGFAVSGGFGSINPNDVESVTVLKDAAAASIWGAKSANGVIVVTTKGGKGLGAKRTNVKVDYSGFYKVSPKLDIDYMLSRGTSSSEFIDYQIETFNKWGANNFYQSISDRYNGGSMVGRLLNEQRLGHITKEEMEAGIEKYRNIDNTEQLRKYLLQNPMTLQENVGISIDTERASTNLSLLWQKNKAYWKGDSDQKYLVSVNNRTSIFKWVDFIFNGTFNYGKSEGKSAGSFPQLASFENLVDENGKTIQYNSFYEWYLEKNVPIDKFPFKNWGWNPIDDMEATLRTNTNMNARAQAGLNFKLWKGLTFDTRLQYEMIDTHKDTYRAENHSEVRNAINVSSTLNKTNNTVTVNLPMGGWLDRSRTTVGVITFRNQLTFNQTFADVHQVAAVAGMETIDYNTKGYTYPRVLGYNPETLTSGYLPDNVSVKNWTGTTTINLRNLYAGSSQFSDLTDRYFSAFANASYTYAGKYTVSGSYRTDASNLITDDPAYRYAPFWSVGAGWQIGKESFMRDFEWMDRLNLRVTYGFNGNVDKSTTFKPLFTTSSAVDYWTGEYTGTVASPGNPTLRWEKTGTWNLGIDYSFFNSKLFGKLDVYNKLSEDLISRREISSVTGSTAMFLNNGKIRNRGFEFEVGTSMNITPKIYWTGTARLGYNRNNVEKLLVEQYFGRNLVQGGSSAWVEGMDMNTLWCFEYSGLINTGTEASPHWSPSVYYENREKVAFVKELDGDGRSYCLNMGTKTAPWNWSFNSAFSLYDFDLSFIITGRFGHVFKRESFNYPAPKNIRYIINSKYSEIKNCDPNVYCPLPQQDDELRFYYWDRFYPYFSYLTESAAHIRMQEVSLSYSVPRNILGKIGVKGVQLTAQCNNPFNIYFNKYNEDPEFGKGSIRLQQSYTLGLKINF